MQVQHHHMREGNLPRDSKCVVCKKNCSSYECLAGMRCGWCSATVGYCAIFQTKLLVCTCVFRWNLFWFYFWARWDEWVYRICARRRKQSDLHYRTDPNLLCGRIRIKTSLAIWAENEFSYFMIFWRWGEFLRAFYWISHVCLIGITL